MGNKLFLFLVKIIVFKKKLQSQGKQMECFVHKIDWYAIKIRVLCKMHVLISSININILKRSCKKFLLNVIKTCVIAICCLPWETECAFKVQSEHTSSSCHGHLQTLKHAKQRRIYIYTTQLM